MDKMDSVTEAIQCEAQLAIIMEPDPTVLETGKFEFNFFFSQN